MSLFHFLRYGSFDHEDIRERDDEGRAILRCTACGDQRYMLASKTVKGPKHDQPQTKGQPIVTVKKVNKKVTDIRERQSQQ